MASCFGGILFDPSVSEPEERADKPLNNYFPDMRKIQNVTLGNRSGLIVITAKR